MGAGNSFTVDDIRDRVENVVDRCQSQSSSLHRVYLLLFEAVVTWSTFLLSSLLFVSLSKIPWSSIFTFNIMHCKFLSTMLLGVPLVLASPLRIQVSYVTVKTIYRGTGTAYLSGYSPTGISAGTGTFIGTAYSTGVFYLSGNSSLTYHPPGYSYATTKAPAPSSTATALSLDDCYVQCGESDVQHPPSVYYDC